MMVFFFKKKDVTGWNKIYSTILHT